MYTLKSMGQEVRVGIVNAGIANKINTAMKEKYSRCILKTACKKMKEFCI